MATLISPKRPSVFNVPNQLTTARLGLGFVLFALIAFEQWLWCIPVFALAAATDWLDGYLARRQGLFTALGRIYDPLVDKVVVCGAYIFLLPVRDSGLLPWMVTVVVGRELIITGMRSFMENRGVIFGADWLGKTKMGLQCAALFAIFVALQVVASEVSPGWRTFFLRVREGLVYAMVVATALSGLQYCWRAWLILRTENDGPIQ